VYNNRTFSHLFLKDGGRDGYLYALNVHSNLISGSPFNPYYAELIVNRVSLPNEQNTLSFERCIESMVVPGVVTHLVFSQTDHSQLALAYRIIGEEEGQINRIRVV
jgi:hypothetical protein